MESVTSPNIDIYKFVEPGMTVDKLNSKRSDPILSRMLVEGLHTDITLTAKGGSVRAHRTVLASVSRVFRAMFSSAWHGSKEQLTSRVDISDMTIDAVQLFLLMLYTTNEETVRSLPIEIEWPAGLPRQLHTAIDKHFGEFHDAVRKFQVEGRLGTVLEAALVRNLTPENCWYYCGVAELGMKPLGCYMVCQRYILSHYSLVIESSESFLLAMKENPKLVHRFVLEAEGKDTRATALAEFQNHIAKLADQSP